MTRQHRRGPTDRGTVPREGVTRRGVPRIGAALGAVLAAGGIGTGALAAEGTAAAATGGFATTGYAIAARAHAASVTLANGDVLLIGGQDANGTPLSSVEEFNPGTHQWSNLPSLATAVTDTTATLLGNGDVLVAGGETGTSGKLAPTGASELFDPSDAAAGWHSAGALKSATTDAGAIRLPNGDVMYIGGFDSTGAPSGAVEIYSGGSWTNAPSALPHAIGDPAVATLPGGDVLVAGGIADATGTVTNLTMRYDAKTSSWATLSATLGTAVADPATVVLNNGDVLLAGGRTKASGSPTGATQLFNPTTNSWQSLADLPTGSYGAAATLLGTGDVLYAGGLTSPSSATAAAALYDPATQSWSSTGPLAVGVGFAIAAPIGNSHALVATGQTGNAASVTAVSEEFAGGNAPVFTTPASLDVRAGAYANLTVRASGTPAPTIGIEGALPPGLAFHDEGNGTATITGRPQVPSGSYTVTLTANNGIGGAVTQRLTLVVASAPRFTSPSSLDLQAGRSLSFTVHASGAPAPQLTLSGDLPPGLVFRPSANGTATISGLPGHSGRRTYAVTIVANNGVGNVSQRLLLTYATPARIAGPSHVVAMQNTPIDIHFTASGTPAPRWSISGALPPGLGFHGHGNATADITGTPHVNAAGTYQLTVRADNGVGPASVIHLSITTRLAVNPAGIGYLYATSTGEVIGRGAASPLAPRTPQHPRAIVSMAELPDHEGYYLASRFGGVYSYGRATFKGSIARLHLRTPVVAIALTPNGTGYYLVTRRGNVFTFGSARFYGSLAARRTAPIAAFGVAPGGAGYWLVTTAGNVFHFGDAGFYGSPVRRRIAPVTAFAPTPNGRGYWLVSRNGAVYPYGDARNFGSLGGRRVPPVSAFAPTLNGGGYWLVTVRGNIFRFGNARFYGSSAHTRLPGPIEGFAPRF